MAGVKPDAIDPDRRVHVATRSLVKTRVEMERNCHNIIQLFANNPIAMNVVTILASRHWHHRVAAWLSGSALASINEVTLCRARGSTGMGDVCGRINHLGL